MNQAVYFSTRVIDTIKALPADERSAMANALTGEFVLGLQDVETQLTAVQRMVYTILRSYVVRDMQRAM